MLVLSRKYGEKIVIDENIVVTVLEVSGDRVRLGFSAPKEVLIVRSELLDQQKEAEEGTESSKA